MPASAFRTYGSPLNTIEPSEMVHYVLRKAGDMSHLKLQKLLYYIDAWHLVFFDKALFNEDFKAWVHGPVLTSVWHMVKPHSQLYKNVASLRPVAEVKAAIAKALSKDQIQLIDNVLEEYGKRTAYELECLTHAEKP